jgi:hypothetical protein
MALLVPTNPENRIYKSLKNSKKRVEWIKVYHDLMEQFLRPLLRFDENDFLRSVIELHSLQTSVSDGKWDAPRNRAFAASNSDASWLSQPGRYTAVYMEFHQLIASIAYYATQGPVCAPTVIEKILGLKKLAEKLKLLDPDIDQALYAHPMVQAIDKVIKKHAGSK